MALEEYYIDKLDYKAAMNIVIEKHYLHRAAPCSFAFGLFREGVFFPELVGVVVYGTPSSSALRKGICGEEYENDVIELTRLWIDDTVPKNGESFLIGNTLNLVDKDIIVSYSEIEEGHIGTVYQATNFLYTGLSAKRTNWEVEGLDKHNHTLVDKYSSQEIRELYGDKFSLVDRPRKHRYVYLKGNKWRKKELKNALKYEIMPYPKKRI